MTRFMRFVFALCAALLVLTSSPAKAQSSIDDKTRDILIEKLTQVYLNLAPADSSKVAVTLRLADLHAERARLQSMNELNSGCTVCEAGKSDRQKALVYYSEVMRRAPTASLGKVMTQVGHLHELLGQEKDAIAVYNQILTEQTSPAMQAEAHLSLAEVYFKNRDFNSAKAHYSAVLANQETSSKGLAAYRLAWCQFNTGELEAATNGLVTILKTPAFLNRNGGGNRAAPVDRQFQEEVSRDLATFLSKRSMQEKDADLLYTLSPESTRLQNVSFFATELERLGQVPAAIQVWRFTQERQSQPEARLEGDIRLAQLEMEQRLRPEAIKDFEAGLTLWMQVKACTTPECQELKARLRKFVLDWNRMEKKNPSPELLEVYQAYRKVFPQETDMVLWTAQVAHQLQQYPLAFSLYKEGSEKLDAVLKAPGAQQKETQTSLEATLLSAIEVAELSKDPVLLDTAYDRYLALSRDQKKALEVQYQKAHIVYEKGEYKKAAGLLKNVALLKTPGSTDVKKQAADLSLDALVLDKDDVSLETWAHEYALLFPDKSSEYQAIARKSVLTQSAAQATVPGPGGPGPGPGGPGIVAPEAGLQLAWETLARFDVGSASNEEKVAYFKNKLILAEKLHRFPQARETVDQLLRLPHLTDVDRQYALTRKAWLAEMVLDFDTALSITEKLQLPDLTSEQRLLRLAMFADLAQKDPRPFYAQYLKESKDLEKTTAIAAQLVRESHEPIKELEKQKLVLGKNRELLGQLYLEIYLKTQNPLVLKLALSQPMLATTAAGKVLSRIVFLEEFAKLRAKITAHQLDASTQKKMATTLKARAALLEQLEKFTQKGVDSGDWTAQLVSLDLLAKQSERFYSEILSLPVPTGLSAEDEQQYLTLLSQQASPYQLKAKDITAKVGEFWKDDKAIDILQATLKTQTGEMRRLVLQEVEILSEVAPVEKKAQLTEIAKIPEPGKEVPALTTLESALQAVRENPLNRESLSGLLDIEKKMGRSAMVSYLESRIETLGQEAIQPGVRK